MSSLIYLVRSPISLLSDTLFQVGKPMALALGIEKATYVRPGEVLWSDSDKGSFLSVGQTLSYQELLAIVIEQKKVITL